MEIVNVQPYSISPLSITIHATALFCFSVRVTVIQFRFFFFVTRRGVLLLCARTLFISLFFFWALTFLAERVSLLRYTSHCAFGWHNEQTCITFFVCVCFRLVTCLDTIAHDCFFYYARSTTRSHLAK